MARGDAGIHGETCLSLAREGCSNKEEGWKSMTIYQESLQDNKPLHSITFRITPYAQEPQGAKREASPMGGWLPLGLHVPPADFAYHDQRTYTALSFSSLFLPISY